MSILLPRLPERPKERQVLGKSTFQKKIELRLPGGELCDYSWLDQYCYGTNLSEKRNCSILGKELRDFLSVL
jgi:hypothetical protein